MTRVFRRCIRLVALAAASAIAACGDTNPSGPPLTTGALKAVLDEAIQDAYHAQFTYTRAVADLGSAGPFSTLAAAEAANAVTIAGLYESRSLAAPASLWSGANVSRYSSVQQGCIAAEEGEQATQMMFERMLALNLPNDVRMAFETIRGMARTQHWSALGSCAGATTGPVSARVAASIAEALQGEYRTFYTRARILADLGSVMPFVTIRDVEWQHVGAAANLFARHGMSVPPSSSTIDNVPRFATSQQACADGVDAGFANAMLYDRLRLQELPTDVARVFGNLRTASLQQIAALQRCAGGGTPGVSSEVLAAMGLALRDELVQQWTYYFIMADVPVGYPFTIVHDAEVTSVEAIENLYVKRSLAVPQTGLVIPAYHSLTAACNAAVASETTIVAMYDNVLGLALPDDVRHLFEALRTAARDHHLPAFRDCGAT